VYNPVHTAINILNQYAWLQIHSKTYIHVYVESDTFNLTEYTVS